MSARRVGTLASIIVGAAVSAVLGQGVGAGSPTDTTLTLGPDAVSTPKLWGALITPWSTVSLDPQGPAWAVHLGSPVADIRSEDSVVLMEFVRVAGDLSWSGWQVDLITPELDWHTGIVRVVRDLVDDGIEPPGFSMTLTGNSLRMTFDPLAPDTKVLIGVSAIYTGSSRFQGTIELRQYPLPEPASFLSVSLLFLSYRRRR